MGGTTSPLALPYPTGTDRVADGDNAIKALAEATDDWLTPLGTTTPQATVSPLTGWTTSACHLMRIGTLCVLRLEANKVTWGAGEAVGQVPAAFRPTYNVSGCCTTNSSGSPTSFYIRAGDGVIIVILAATSGAGLTGNATWAMG